MFVAERGVSARAERGAARASLPDSLERLTQVWSAGRSTREYQRPSEVLLPTPLFPRPRHFHSRPPGCFHCLALAGPLCRCSSRSQSMLRERSVCTVSIHYSNRRKWEAFLTLIEYFYAWLCLIVVLISQSDVPWVFIACQWVSLKGRNKMFE